MGYDLCVYIKSIRPYPMLEWVNWLNSVDKNTYEIHPDIKFDLNRSGFCPIKVSEPQLSTNTKHYLSGFEMDILTFDFDDVHDMLTGDKRKKEEQYRVEGYDTELWRKFKFRLLISFKPYCRFEPELAFQSATFFTKYYEGVFEDPQTGKKLSHDNDISGWIQDRLAILAEQNSGNQLNAYPFEKWL